MESLKKIFGIGTIVLLLGIGGFLRVFATPNNLHIIPESMTGEEEAIKDVKYIGDAKGEGTALDRYGAKVKEIEDSGDVGRAFQTGIMGWGTLLQYVVYLMKFLSQLGLLIGGIMILYAGYLYATTIFGAGDPNKAKSAIKNAIIGILVVVFSYAIRRGLVSFFL